MITEELLAAFEEGKTNAEETALVLEYLATDESLQEEFILSQQLDAMMGADDEETTSCQWRRWQPNRKVIFVISSVSSLF